MSSTNFGSRFFHFLCSINPSVGISINDSGFPIFLWASAAAEIRWNQPQKATASHLYFAELWLLQNNIRNKNDWWYLWLSLPHLVHRCKHLQNGISSFSHLLSLCLVVRLWTLGLVCNSKPWPLFGWEDFGSKQRQTSETKTKEMLQRRVLASNMNKRT